MVKLEKVFKEECLNLISLLETGKSTPNYQWFSLTWAHGGTSGLSFSPVQFDLSTNSTGRILLYNLGFSNEEIQNLQNIKRTPENASFEITDLDESIRALINRANKTLQSPEGMKMVILNSKNYVSNALDWIFSLDGISSKITEIQVFFMLDYHIQFNISREGRFHRWLKENNGTFNIYDFMQYKQGLPWYSKPEGKKDVERRYKLLKDYALSLGYWIEEESEVQF